jgi:fucose permease
MPFLKTVPPGNNSLFPAQSATTFVLVTGLFFLWGIPNNFNDVLIRQFMKSFAITRFEARLDMVKLVSGYKVNRFDSPYSLLAGRSARFAGLSNFFHKPASK